MKNAHRVWHTHTYAHTHQDDKREAVLFFGSDLFEEVQTMHHFAVLYCDII